MNIEEAKELRNKATQLIGKEMKYKELADCFGMKYATHNTKNHQLNDIAEVCDIEKLDKPTRYIIHSVYDDNDIMLIGGEYQQPFEYMIAKLLEHNNFDNLYLTNTQLLTYLSLVNENYKILKSPKLRHQLQETTGDVDKYDTLYQASSNAGVMLKQWVDRLMKNMERRGLILYRKGFCLIKEHDIGNDVKILVPYNVPFSTGVGDMENRILTCWSDTVCELGLDKYKNDFIPYNMTEIFYKTFNAKIKQEFNGKYVGAYKCNVITSSKASNIKFIEDTEKIMNDKAYDYIKVSQDARLQSLTGFQRQALLDEVIKIPPSVRYKDINNKE